MAKPRGATAALARRYTREAIETLIEILRDLDAPPSARNAAARSLLARGLIKSPTSPDDPRQNSASRLN
jgi:HEAT repeat protein